jgi:hypothetical protein
MRIAKRISILLTGALVAAGALSAQTFYNNLGTTVRGYGSISYYNGLYNGFTTGSTAVNLTDVQVKLELLGTASGSVTVALYASAQQQQESGALVPGALNRALVRPVNYFSLLTVTTVGAQLRVLGTISDSSVSTSGQNYNFPVNPGYPLSPNTLYFIGLTTTNDSEIGWAYNDESDSVSGGGTGTVGQYNCYGAHYDGAGDGIIVCRSNGDGSDLEDDPFLMLVTGGVPSVPAFSPVALVALGLLLLASPLWMIRKKYRYES